MKMFFEFIRHYTEFQVWFLPKNVVGVIFGDRTGLYIKKLVSINVS